MKFQPRRNYWTNFGSILIALTANLCFHRLADDADVTVIAGTRFNYLGEWHSHPSFEPLPSDTDIRTMQSLVEDPDVGVNFLVLMVCRMASGRGRVLELTATAFRAGANPLAVPISVEPEPEGQNVKLVERVRRFIDS